MKIGNFEVPDKKLLIIGFPKGTKEEIETFRDTFLKAKEGSIMTCTYTFEKVSETDEIVVINAKR